MQQGDLLHYKMDLVEKILDELRNQRGYIEREEYEELSACIENIQTGIDELSATGISYTTSAGSPRINEMMVEMHKLMGMNIEAAGKKLDELRDRIKTPSACGLYIDRQG